MNEPKFDVDTWYKSLSTAQKAAFDLFDTHDHNPGRGTPIKFRHSEYKAISFGGKIIN